MTADKPGFLTRWARRKAESREKTRKGEDGKPAPAAASTAIPPVESLTGDSDYRAFVGQDVPPELHRAALRRLWMSDPQLNAPDVFEMHSGNFAGQPAEMMRVAADLGRRLIASEPGSRSAHDIGTDAPGVEPCSAPDNQDEHSADADALRSRRIPRSE